MLLQDHPFAPGADVYVDEHLTAFVPGVAMRVVVLDGTALAECLIV